MEMNIDESKLIPNSGVSKVSEEKRVEKPVVKAKVSTQKKPISKKVLEAFVGEEVGDVKSYLIFDILIPSMKNTFSDLVSTAVNMILFGEARRPSRIERDGYKSYSSYYNKSNYRYSDYRPLESRYSSSFNKRAAHEFDDILFESRQDAEEVLSHLVDLVEIYKCATVADLYDLVGQTSAYTDRGFGWTELGRASVKRMRDGYILDLPKVVPL